MEIIRGSIKKLKKLAKLKENNGIRDRIYAGIFDKKKSQRTIGESLHRSVSWVNKWLNRYKDLGVQGLYDRPRSGRPSKLSFEDAASFIQRIQDGPVDFDIVSVFMGRYIGKILKTEYNCAYSTSGVYSLLSRLGFTKLKPRPNHEKNDPQIMLKWKTETLPKFFKEVKKFHPNKEIEFWFQDETRFGEKTSVSPIWQLAGSKTSLTKGTGYRANYIYGAVNPITGDSIGLVHPDTCTEVMNVHLDLISRAVQSNKHIILIMDQAGWHSKSTELKIPENISILSLPPYSPQLNPVERLWGWLKANFLNNRFIDKKCDLNEIGIEVWSNVTCSIVKKTCKTNYIEVFTN